MHFKKDKALIMQDVQMKIQASLHAQFTNFYFGDHTNIGDMKTKLSAIISSAVARGVEVALDNMYTEDDFERDLTLK